MASQSEEAVPLEKRPGILVIGSPTVGKRTLLSRLLGLDLEDGSDSSPAQLAGHGWSIDTKYYTADVSVWMTHLDEQFSIEKLPMYDQLAALIMVFDTTELSSLVALQKWVSHNDLQKFDILLCIGNKVDLVPGHPVHFEYRRRLLKVGEPFADSQSDFTEYGISETEGSSLLGEDEPAWEARGSCLEWCTKNNLEYIEACGSNAEFEKCLSVDGDSQGVERLFGALSAHMWPGMILKTGHKITEPSLPEREDSSEEEYDYEFKYDVLSAGSAEPFDDMDKGWGWGWVSANDVAGTSEMGRPDAQNNHVQENGTTSGNDKPHASTSKAALHSDMNKEVVVPNVEEPDGDTVVDQGQELDADTPFEIEDLEQLMSEIGNMRDSLRLMPDFQRREMAAKLAMKMASMFGGESDNEQEVEA